MPLTERETLWASATFTSADLQAGRLLAVSQAIQNPSYRGCRVEIDYETLDPDGASVLTNYRLEAQLQEELAPGVWTPIGIQMVSVDESTDALRHVIEVSPTVVFNPGTIEWVQENGQNAIGISRFEGTVGDKVRVVVYAHEKQPGNPSGHADLMSVTLSGYLKLFS